MTTSSATTASASPPAWSGYAPFAKRDTAQHMVSGIASTDRIDQQAGTWDGIAYSGDKVDLAALAAALPGYQAWGNIREMHQQSAVGIALRSEIVNDALELDAKIVDTDAWQKVTEGVYKGFSIGGRVTSAEIRTTDDGTVYRAITGLDLTEISIVDRPANPDARISVWKAADATTPPSTVTRQEHPMDIREAQRALQAARDAAELSGDFDGAAAFDAAVVLSVVAQPAETTTLAKKGRKFGAGARAKLHAAIQSIAAMLKDDGDDVAAAVGACYGKDAGSDDDSADSAAKDDSSADDYAADDDGGDMSAARKDDSSADDYAADDDGGDMSASRKARKARKARKDDDGGDVSASRKARKDDGDGDVSASRKSVAIDDLAKAIHGVTALLQAQSARLEALEAQPAEVAPARMRPQAVEKTLPGAAPGSRDARAAKLAELQKAVATEIDPFKKARLGEEITALEIRRTLFGG